MKSLVVASIIALVLTGFAAPRTTTAQTAGQSASGTYKFIFDDDLTRYVDFAASSDARGTTTGSMSFTDDTKFADTDVDGTGEPVGEPMPFYMKASFDTMSVEKNRALMSGMIVDSSHRAYIGRWVQLVVEDNGLNNKETPDRLVWRLCQQQPSGWVPEDSEVPGDRGAWMSWWATDAEQKGDVGIPSKNLIPDSKTRCEVFSLWTYSFAELKMWDGDLVVGQ